MLSRGLPQVHTHTHTYLRQDVIGYFVQRVVAPGAASCFAPAPLGEQQRIKQQLGLLQVLGDVHVVVHPEDLGALRERQFLRKDNRPIDKGMKM